MSEITMKNQTEEEDEVYTITQAANLLHLTRQGIYVAIKHRGLKATMINDKWIIKRKDLVEYNLNKYSREKKKIDGKPLFSVEEGEYSVNHLSKLFGCPPQHIYYLLRIGALTAKKKGASWVISREEVQRIYKERFQENQKLMESVLNKKK